MKIAVIGSGISGLSSAYYLSKKHKIDLFEKADRFGGHSYTLDVQYNEKNKVAVDIGFMVFNKITYPNLINFFLENNIEIEKSDMSFSVSVNNTNIEYCGKGIKGIFSNKSNLFNLKFLKMFFEIINFYKKCEDLDLNQIQNKITLGEYLKDIKISNYFIDFHIIPMVSAIWSMPPYEASQMPLTFFINFFKKCFVNFSGCFHRYYSRKNPNILQLLHRFRDAWMLSCTIKKFGIGINSCHTVDEPIVTFTSARCKKYFFWQSSNCIRYFNSCLFHKSVSFSTKGMIT